MHLYLQFHGYNKINAFISFTMSTAPHSQFLKSIEKKVQKNIFTFFPTNFIFLDIFFLWVVFPGNM